MQRSRQHKPAVTQHPSRDGNIKHHENVVTYRAHNTESMPPGPTGFQLFQGVCHITLCGTSHGKLHNEYRKTDENQKKQIYHQKYSTAILAGNIGKTPYIAESYGAAGGKKQKTQSAGELFTLIHESVS